MDEQIKSSQLEQTVSDLKLKLRSKAAKEMDEDDDDDSSTCSSNDTVNKSDEDN